MTDISINLKELTQVTYTEFITYIELLHDYAKEFISGPTYYVLYVEPLDSNKIYAVSKYDNKQGCMVYYIKR